MLDNHGQLPPGDAIELGRALAPFGLLFFEEPVPPDTPDALGKSGGGAAAAPTGDRRAAVQQVGVSAGAAAGAGGRGAAGYLPRGGFTEVRKIAAMAESAYIRIAPHNPNGPVATMASVQLAAAIPNFLILEMAQQALREPVQRWG